ncbi:MAG: TIR domain-containing protein [Saprospiraceae bacterium]|nr:TIR domain-containing protein [Saprospiraceae bacterium]
MAKEIPLKTFIMYAREDHDVRDKLRRHLAVQVSNGILDLWGDHEIIPGEDWDRAISAQLAQAELLILLLSADFFASHYIQQHELPAAMRRHEQGKCRLLPVIARDCDWEAHPISKIQALPSGDFPICSNQWPSTDMPYKLVVEGIKSAARDIQESRRQIEQKRLQAIAAEEARIQREKEQKIRQEQLERERAASWQRAQDLNTEQAWADFLHEHGDSLFSSVARKNMDTLRQERLLREAEERDRKRRDELRAQEAQRVQEAWIRQQQEAQAKQEQQAAAARQYEQDVLNAWKKVERQNKTSAYLQFLQDYPNNPYVEDALLNIKQLRQKKRQLMVFVPLGMVVSSLLAWFFIPGFSQTQDTSAQADFVLQDSTARDSQPVAALQPQPRQVAAPSPRKPAAATPKDLSADGAAPARDSLAKITDTDPETAAIRKAKEEAKKKQQAEQERVRKQEADRLAEQDRQRQAAEEAAKQEQARRDKIKGSFGSSFGSGAARTGQGNTGKPGNQGVPGDNPFGTSTGSGGGAGGGDGVGISIGGGLGGRKIQNRPTMVDNTQKGGIIVVRIAVNEEGVVTVADYTQAGSTTNDSELRKMAVTWARQFRFAPSAAADQTGTITFKFTVK